MSASDDNVREHSSLHDKYRGDGAVDPDIAVASDAEQDAPETEVAEEVLVEEVSIDGMCGVY